MTTPIHRASWESWKSAATVGTYDPLDEDRLAEMFMATCRYGSGNLWTGTTGTLAGYVRELLREVSRLRHAIKGTDDVT